MTLQSEILSTGSSDFPKQTLFFKLFNSVLKFNTSAENLNEPSQENCLMAFANIEDSDQPIISILSVITLYGS